MTGADVGMVEKKQGSATFPESEPVTGLIIDNVLDAERQNTWRLNAAPAYIATVITVFILLFIFFYVYFEYKCIYLLWPSCK